ncbi:hypothetical protein HGP14_23620 [Rhizobium sp. P32RR-XVIII]|uniref:hypothetical protein n=1 Tax=Rhizobium sp. P32RR-XVIII TaxID=2726738 RepID=UPI0014573F33|nr:hypothetical protein [Rhizobium sp. P32RR-XVIII]NLS06311.1 hypothetical protein [Rhizobium sp. P32RR-XVIII]
MKTINVKNLAPFDERDLAACQPLFDRLLQEAKVAKDSEEAKRIAATLVELYRQGIRDPESLRIMVEGDQGHTQAF